MALAVKGSDWNEAEVQLCVDAYFQHLALELRGGTFVKAEIYRKLSDDTGRTRKSIEFKFQNISAVLDALGREWMRGLAPLANFQELLAEKVARHIDAIDHIPLVPAGDAGTPDHGFKDPAAFYLEPPPELNKAPLPVPDFIERLARKFDPVARDTANRALGLAGESFVVQHERRFLDLIGRPDLASNVRWVSQEEGDGAGYDILSFSDRGEKKFIEVKTTLGGSRTPFFVSRNEFDFCRQEADRYRLVRLYDYRKGLRGFEIAGRIDRYVNLSTEVYRAEFRARQAAQDESP